MTVLPVIARELRAAARQTSTYSLRINGVVALLAVCACTVNPVARWNDGGAVFAYLHAALFLAIWVLVPLSAADCISRERRDGTLPLLFLTPLKAGDIVLAKVLAHGLTAFTLWLAALPVLTIPFVAGGVGWRQAVFSILVNFSSMCLALAAGLVASAQSKVHARALLQAGCWAFFFCLGFIVGTGGVSILVFSIMGPGPPPRLLSVLSNPGNLLEAGTALVLSPNNFWQRFPGLYRPTLVSLGISAGLSVLALWMLFLLAASRLKSLWREPPPSPRTVWLEKKFCTPILFRRVFRRWMSWELERNPVGWLERRSWSGRLVMWSWFAVVVSIYISVLANLDLYQRVFHLVQCFLACLLAGSMAVSAAGSFRRERESGMLELLLVAPLKEWQVLGGRLRGLWFQFLPAGALLLGLWLYCSTYMTTGREWPSIVIFAGTFLSLPVIGLYFSLVKRGFLSAFLWTLLVGVALPAFFSVWEQFLTLAVLDPFARRYLSDLLIPWLFTSVQAAAAGLLAWRLHSDLKHRRFAVQR